MTLKYRQDMRWDKNELHELYSPLKKQSQTSIYYNAVLPINKSIDLNLMTQSESSPIDFIQQLLGSGNVEAEIEAKEEFAANFHHLYTSQFNSKSEQGKQYSAFGYPMFIDSQAFNAHPLVAPLFIWSVEIEPSPYRVNSWLIQRKTRDTIVPNYFLIQYLQDEYNLDIKAEMEAFVKHSNPTTQHISALCQRIIQEVGISTPFPEAPTLLRIPEMNDFPFVEQNEALLHPSGVLGQFKEESLALLHHVEEEFKKEGELTLEETIEEDTTQHSFSLVCPDACQKHIVSKAQQQKITIGEGGTGSGKTFTVAHAASNALANGKTCLIISPNNRGLEQIYNILNNNKLGGLTYLFQNEKDVQPFFQSLKQNALSSTKSNKEQDLAFQILLKRAIGKHEKIAENHRLINQNAFGDLDFTNTVGRYIHSGRNAGKDLLSGRLDAKDYSFTFREYDILKTDITKGERLFGKVQRLQHPLQALHDELFLENDLEKSESFIKKQLSTFQRKAEKLLRQFSSGMESYRDNLQEHYEEHAKELYEKLSLINNKIHEYEQVFGEDFKRSGSVKLQMYGVFSDTYFNIKEARKEIQAEIEELQEFFDEKRYFEYKFPSKKDLDTIGGQQIMLKDFGQSLKHWMNHIPNTVQRESQTLSSKSVQIHLDYKSRIGELEYQHDLLLEELNQSKLFNEWFSYDGLTLTKRMQSVEELLTLMDNTERELSHFSDFHPWQRHWLEVLPLSRNTTEALIQSRAKKWLPAFDSWYFYNCLSERSFLAQPTSDDFKENYIEDLARIRALFPTQIQQIWNEKKDNALEKLRKKDKKKYQLITQRKGKLSAEASLKNMLETYPNAIPNCFPIVMLTPSLAEKLLLSSDINFDYVIMDDAHDISSLQGIFFLKKAQRALLLGDRRRALSTQESKNILSHLIEKGIDVHSLSYSQQTKQYACTQYLNHTSYMHSLKQIHYFKNDGFTGIHLENCEGGRYLEDKSCNPLEAEHIIRILAKIPKKKDGTLPQMAIVANTIAQRDHISSHLLYLKQKRNPYSDKIQQLEQQGLRVLHLSELNRSYDTILWSMTYAPMNLKGTMTQDFNPMEGSLGQSAINIVLGNTAEQLIVCSSIPPSYWNTKDEHNKHSHGAITQFLKYAHLITHQADEAEITAYLQSIEWPSLKHHKDNHEFSFMQQVRQELEPYFEPERIQLTSPLSEIGTSAITIMPLDYRQPIPLIIGDALDRNTPVVASEFEQNIRRKLVEAGYQLYPIRSIEWWKNPKREARKLASLLIKADNTVPEEVLMKE